MIRSNGIFVFLFSVKLLGVLYLIGWHSHFIVEILLLLIAMVSSFTYKKLRFIFLFILGIAVLINMLQLLHIYSTGKYIDVLTILNYQEVTSLGGGHVRDLFSIGFFYLLLWLFEIKCLINKITPRPITNFLCIAILVIFWIGTYKAGQPLYLKEGSFSLSKPLAIWC